MPLTPVPSVRVLPKEVPTTFSEESQFVISGSDGASRSSVFHSANEIRQDLIQALGRRLQKGIDPKKGQLPIHIKLMDRFNSNGKSIRGQVMVIFDELALKVSVATLGGIDRAEFREEIVRWLLVDLMLRRVRPDTLSEQSQIDLPDWLHQGCLELMDFRLHGRPSDVFASVFQLGESLTIDEILEADITGLDSVSLGIYRVSSCALLLLLLDQPDGVDRLLKCIADIPARQSSMDAHLQKHFPFMRGSGNTLEKWWSLTLATYSEPSQTELMTMIQSEKRLKEILVFSFTNAVASPPAPKSKLPKFLRRKITPPPNQPNETDPPANKSTTIPVIAYSQILKRKDVRSIAQAPMDGLTRASFRIHPFYRPVISGYLEQLSKIASGKDHGVDEALKTLANKRETMFSEACSSEDYIDWYEATQRTEPSGKFYNYLKSADQLENPGAQRTDPISSYMNAMEKEFR